MKDEEYFQKISEKVLFKLHDEDFKKINELSEQIHELLKVHFPEEIEECSHLFIESLVKILGAYICTYAVNHQKSDALSLVIHDLKLICKDMMNNCPDVLKEELQ